MGSFFALYGRNETLALIARAIKGEDLAAGGGNGRRTVLLISLLEF